ncbi:MAG: hypothetical protein ACPGJS_12015 [Flammeovirgaceae bacterium]
MILLSILGWAILFCLLLWQLLLSFQKNWVFQRGDRIHFLMPARTFSKQLSSFVGLGFVLISVLIWVKGTIFLQHTVIAASSWMLSLCYVFAFSSRLVTIRPEGVNLPFRFSVSFDHIHEIRLLQHTIDFQLLNKVQHLSLAIPKKSNEKRTVLMLMETLKTTALLHGVDVADEFPH